MKQICVCVCFFFLSWGIYVGWEVQIRSQFKTVSQHIKAVHSISAPLSPLSPSIQSQQFQIKLSFLFHSFSSSELSKPDWATQEAQREGPTIF